MLKGKHHCHFTICLYVQLCVHTICAMHTDGCVNRTTKRFNTEKMRRGEMSQNKTKQNNAKYKWNGRTLLQIEIRHNQIIERCKTTAIHGPMEVFLSDKKNTTFINLFQGLPQKLFFRLEFIFFLMVSVKEVGTKNPKKSMKSKCTEKKENVYILIGFESKSKIREIFLCKWNLSVIKSRRSKLMMML